MFLDDGTFVKLEDKEMPQSVEALIKWIRSWFK